MPDDEGDAGSSPAPGGAPSAPGLGSHPGVGAPAPPPPMVVPHRSRALYDQETGKLDVKKLGAWVTGLVAVIGTISATMGKIESGVKWWLEIDALEARVVSCEAQLEAINNAEPPRDANQRLDDALPRISHELRDGRKERQTHEQAITRLSTIHEYGLTRTREREAAQEARQSIQWRRESVGGAGADGSPDTDPLVSIENL